jgi:hypothetical protein
MIMGTDAQQGVLLNIVVGRAVAFLGGLLLSPLFGRRESLNQGNFSIPALPDLARGGGGSCWRSVVYSAAALSEAAKSSDRMGTAGGTHTAPPGRPPLPIDRSIKGYQGCLKKMLLSSLSSCVMLKSLQRRIMSLAL